MEISELKNIIPETSKKSLNKPNSGTEVTEERCGELEASPDQPG